jgi:hypothetical protein
MKMRLSALPALAIVVLVVGGSLMLDHLGTVTQAKVLSLKEDIVHRRHGRWTRTFEMSVEVPNLTPSLRAPEHFVLAADAETHDRTKVGDRVDVRLLDFGREPLRFVRLANRSTFTPLAQLVTPGSARGPWHESTAVVREVRHIEEFRPGSGSISQTLFWPFDVVEFEFRVPTRAAPVRAVDRIESGTLPRLSPGHSIRIRWAEDDPRAARLIDGREGSLWKNLLADLALGVALVFLIFVPLRLWRSRRRAERFQGGRCR